MIKLFKNLEFEWKIIILAAIVLFAFAFPLQSIYLSKLQSTLYQSVDPGLETLLRTFIKAGSDSVDAAIVSGIQRNRQWQALIPIIIEEQCTAMVLLSIVLIVTLLIVAFWSLKKLTKPLKDLSIAAEQIGKGNCIVIKAGAGGALGKLESAMSTMQDELIKLREKAHLQGMETAWRDIARVMAHEIKNPLTPIQLTLDRMQEKIETGSTIEYEALCKFVGRINSQISNLERLVNDFRSFAKEPEPNMRPVVLREFFSPCLFDAASVKMEIDGDAVVEADPFLLQRVFLNLWKNSLEAGADMINVRIKSDAELVTVRFIDNGTGIAGENLQKIWLPYYTSKKTGTGLGLPVVKRLLQSMGASIEILSSNSNENHGVTAVIVFVKGNLQSAVQGK